MTVFANLVRFYSTTTGTNDITIGAAVSGYVVPSLANGSVVSYGIRDGANSEVGRGSITDGVLARTTVYTSTAAGAKINLSGTEEVYLSFLAEDIDFVSDAAYGAGWDGDTTHAPSKNAVYDKINALSFADTKANVIAATKTAGQVGYATDTHELYISLGGGTWRVIPFPTLAESGVDMGIPNENNRLGYGDDYITDKTLSNVQIGTATNTNEGGVWVDPSSTSPRKFYMRLNSVNNTILIDFSTSAGYLVHYPFISTQAVKVWSGMSAQVGQNGRPIINEYEVDMGAFPAPRVLSGGTF